MVILQRHYLALLALVLTGSAFLYLTQQSDEHNPNPKPEVERTVHLDNGKSNVVTPNNLFISNGTHVVEEAPLRPTPRISRKVDWNRYPGTLNDQALRALDQRDGSMAADIANKLKWCDITSRLLKPSNSDGKWASQDIEVQAEHVKLVQGYQRINANCQTVAGDPQQLRFRLLDLAIEKKVVGAAAERFGSGLDTQSPTVLQSVVQDAQAGDINSLTVVAYQKATVFDIPSDTQRAIRYAMELAAHDPVVGEMVRPYLGIAESMSVPLGGETSPKFDHSGLSEATQNEGKAIAERIIKRIKNPEQ